MMGSIILARNPPVCLGNPHCAVFQVQSERKMSDDSLSLPTYLADHWKLGSVDVVSIYSQWEYSCQCHHTAHSSHVVKVGL